LVVLGKAESVLIGSCYIWDLAAVFALAEKRGYVFIDFITKEELSQDDLMAYKSNKIDKVLEFKLS
jgi:fructose-1,6-bisphosphatase/inositol monophosphatase family enzyme